MNLKIEFNNWLRLLRIPSLDTKEVKEFKSYIENYLGKITYTTRDGSKMYGFTGWSLLPLNS